MDKKLEMKIDGTSKVDITKIDLSAQTRMFSGGVDSYSIENFLTKDIFEQILKKVARPVQAQPVKGK